MTQRRLGRLLADVGPLRDSPLYRGLFAGQTVSAMGTQITAIALAYQVYALTRSTFDVGLLGVAVLVPLVLVGLLGGSLVDAVDRRRLVLITSSVMATSSVLLAVQAFTGAARVWPLYLLAALTGGASALDQPARSTFIPRLLGTEQVAAASALGQLSMNLSLTGGPLLGGLLIVGPGLGWAYSVDAVSFAAALAAVVRLPAMRPDGASVRPGLRATAEGLAWVRRHPVVMMTFLVDIDAMVFGMPRALFPAMAATRYGGGGTTLGLLSAAPAVGAVVAAVLSGPLSRVGRQGRGVLVSVAVWGAAIAGFGLTRSLGAGLGFLAVAGAADMVSGVFRSTILLTAAPDELRGRLQGVFFVVVAGGPRLGDVESGSAASLVGLGPAAWSGGLLCLVGLAALALAVPAFARYDATPPTGPEVGHEPAGVLVELAEATAE